MACEYCYKTDFKKMRTQYLNNTVEQVEIDEIVYKDGADTILIDIYYIRLSGRASKSMFCPQSIEIICVLNKRMRLQLKLVSFTCV